MHVGQRDLVDPDDGDPVRVGAGVDRPRRVASSRAAAIAWSRSAGRLRKIRCGLTAGRRDREPRIGFGHAPSAGTMTSLTPGRSPGTSPPRPNGDERDLGARTLDAVDRVRELRVDGAERPGERAPLAQRSPCEPTSTRPGGDRGVDERGALIAEDERLVGQAAADASPDPQTGARRRRGRPSRRRREVIRPASGSSSAPRRRGGRRSLARETVDQEPESARRGADVDDTPPVTPLSHAAPRMRSPARCRS